MRVFSVLLIVCLLGIFPAYASPPAQGGQTVIHQDDFARGVEPWVTFAEGASTVALSAEGGTLVGAFNTAFQTPAGMIRPMFGMPRTPEGVSITLQAQGRPFTLIFGAHESDESWYNTTVHVDPASGARQIDIAFSWLTLSADSTDENDQLDLDQLALFSVVDASGFIGPEAGPGVLRVNAVVFWQGDEPALDITCSATTATTNDLLVGTDASYIPFGEQHHARWFDGDTPIADPVIFLADQGVEALRLRVWVGEEGESKLNEATELAVRAHDAGMQVYPVLFLTDYWADVTNQPTAAIWADLTVPDRAREIRAYARATVAHLLAIGITPPYYAIGNEIDYGISGVFAEQDQRDALTLQNTIWPAEATLIRAAIEGVRAADPDAKIMLHIAQSWNLGFVRSFYGTMRDLGVDYDVAGLSFYPAAQGPFAFDGFCQTLDVLHTEFNLPVVIAEWAYPAQVTQPTEMFNDWRHVVPGYPATPQGQADYVAHFLRDMRDHPAVIGAYYFSPTFYWQPDIWETFALFAPDGRAYPAWDEFDLP